MIAKHVRGRFYSRRYAFALIALAATLTGGCGTATPKVAAKPAPWAGPALLKTLGNLPNYAYTASIHEVTSERDLTYAQDATRHGKDYLEDVLGTARSQAFMGATSLAYVGGNYYISITTPPSGSGFTPGWYKLGKKASGPYFLVLKNFSEIGLALRGMLQGSTATAAGSCAALGQRGIAWKVKFLLPQGAGPSTHAPGTACTEKASGAPLTIDLSYSAVDAQGQPVTISDHFRMTSLGTVPALDVPAGAVPAPKVSYAP